MKNINNTYQYYYPKNNREVFEEFSKLHDGFTVFSSDKLEKKWNKRADYWEQERKSNRKSDYRMKSAVNLLTEKGILNESTSLCDIGCGPGKFAAEFGKVCKSVTGLDISPKMVSYGMEHIKREGLTNVQLKTCDFEKMDVREEGYYKEFDVVFASFTPAIHDLNTLIKAMEMSKGYCCLSSHIDESYPLRNRIMEEVFGRTLEHRWTGKSFYIIFNELFLMGYNPETSYNTRNQENAIVPNMEYVEHIMERMLDEEEQTAENGDKILNWLKNNCDNDGKIVDNSSYTYGTIIWDTRNKVTRSQYYNCGK